MKKLLKNLGIKKDSLKEIKTNKELTVKDRLKAAKEVNQLSEQITNLYAPKPKDL